MSDDHVTQKRGVGYGSRRNLLRAGLGLAAAVALPATAGAAAEGLGVGTREERARALARRYRRRFRMEGEATAADAARLVAACGGRLKIEQDNRGRVTWVLRWEDGTATLLAHQDPEPETLVFGCAHVLLPELLPPDRGPGDEAGAVRFGEWAYVRAFVWPFLTGSAFVCPRVAALQWRREMGLTGTLTPKEAEAALVAHLRDVAAVREDLQHAYLLHATEKACLPEGFPEFVLMFPRTYTREERSRAAVALLGQGLSLSCWRSDAKLGAIYGHGDADRLQPTWAGGFRERAEWGERFAAAFLTGRAC